jgi:hypothetical protein
MSESLVLQRLRRLLLVLAILVSLGVIAELVITEHTDEPLQWVPIGLCTLTIIVALVVLFRPERNTLLMLRGVMLVAMLSGVVGMFVHLDGNLEFAREVNAVKASASPIAAAFEGGNPPLAPGAMGVLGMITLLATYAHPAANRANQ